VFDTPNATFQRPMVKPILFLYFSGFAVCYCSPPCNKTDQNGVANTPGSANEVTKLETIEPLIQNPTQSSKTNQGGQITLKVNIVTIFKIHLIHKKYVYRWVSKKAK